MGMIVNGKWTEEDKIFKNGEYIRQVSTHNEEICDEIINAIYEQPGRFHLITSWSCPWSHRANLIRQIKGLSPYVRLHVTGGKRVQGYPANNGNKWQVPGSERKIIHLHELYTLNDLSYTGRSTVPVLWDSFTLKVVSNESSKIIRAFDAVTIKQSNSLINRDFTLIPDNILTSIDALNEQIYHCLSNGVYRARFAQSQHAYEEAVKQVFGMLEVLDTRLASNRYLFGDVITESDWCLFPTLVRFDIDYHLHSGCSQLRLTDFPNLWGYARDLYSIDGVSKTVNFQAIHLSNYIDSVVVPLMPVHDWNTPHNRDEIGKRCVMSRIGEKFALDRTHSLCTA